MKKTAAWVLVFVSAVAVLGAAACSRGRTPSSEKDLAGAAHRQSGAVETLQSMGYLSGVNLDKAKAMPAGLAPAQLLPPAETPAAGAAGSASRAVAGFVPQPRDRARDRRKVVRNAELILAAKDTGEVVRRLTRIAPACRGYVAGVSSAKDGDLMSYVLTLKVPADAFERALEEVKTAALRVDAESVSTEDVTDQFVDLDARSRALRGTEKELLSLLSESRSRGSKVGDIMEVFGELTSIRTQIEQIQGQMRQMEQITAFSTLRVVVRPDALAHPVVTASWRPSETLHADLAVLAGIGRSLVDLGIGVLVLGLPAALVALLGALAIRRMYRMVRSVSGTSAGAA
jgi:hypothetical protein